MINSLSYLVDHFEYGGWKCISVNRKMDRDVISLGFIKGVGINRKAFIYDIEAEDMINLKMEDIVGSIRRWIDANDPNWQMELNKHKIKDKMRKAFDE